MYVFLFLNMCVQACVHVGAYAHGIPAGGGQKFPPYFLRWDLSLNLEFTDGARLDSKEVLRIPLPLPPQGQDYRYVPPYQAFHMDAGHLSSGPFYLPEDHFTN